MKNKFYIIICILSVLFCFNAFAKENTEKSLLPKGIKEKIDKLENIITYYTKDSLNSGGILSYITLKNGVYTFALEVRTKDMPGYIYADKAFIFDSKTFEKAEIALTNVQRQTKRGYSTAYMFGTSSGSFGSSIGLLDASTYSFERDTVIFNNYTSLENIYNILKNSKKVKMRISGEYKNNEFTLPSSQIKDAVKMIEFYKKLTESIE